MAHSAQPAGDALGPGSETQSLLRLEKARLSACRSVCCYQDTIVKRKAGQSCALLGNPSSKRDDLDEAGKHGVFLLLVLVAKLLAQRLLLVARPLAHVNDAGADEEQDGPAAADHDDASPSHDLEHVVGAGDEVAADAVRDAALGSAGLAQAGEMLMDSPVAVLANDKGGETEKVEKVELLASRPRHGAVDVQGAQETGKEPVEGRVAEDVEGGHGVGRELVDEESLPLALEEVNLEEGKDNPLHGHHGRLGLILVKEGFEAIDVRAEIDDKSMEKDGTKVFNNEDSAPRDLGSYVQRSISICANRSDEEKTGHTKILDNKLRGRCNARLVANKSLAVLENLLGSRVEQADAVEVADARLLGNQLLGILNSDIAGQLDRGRKLLDRLLGRPVGQLHRECGSHGCCPVSSRVLAQLRHKQKTGRNTGGECSEKQG